MESTIQREAEKQKAKIAPWAINGTHSYVSDGEEYKLIVVELITLGWIGYVLPAPWRMGVFFRKPMPTAEDAQRQLEAWVRYKEASDAV